MKWILFAVSSLLITHFAQAQCTSKADRDALISNAYDGCFDPAHAPGATKTIIYKTTPIFYAGLNITHTNVICWQEYPPEENIDPGGTGMGNYNECDPLGPPPGPGGCGFSMCCGGGGGGGSAGGGGSNGGFEKVTGSIINVDFQSLGEVIPLVGVPFGIQYSTDLVKDRDQYYKADLLLSGSSISSNATGFNIKIYDETDALIVNQSYSAATDLSYPYTWNGNYANSSPAEGAIRYRYVVKESNSVAGDIEIGFPLILGTFQAKSIGLGHWLPEMYRFYDVQAKRVVYANGDTRSVTATYNSTTGRYEVAEEDGSEFVEYLSTGRVKYIRTGVTGQTKYEFSYDGSGRLTEIEDGYGKTTTFNRNGSGVWTSITTPYNKTINVTIDGSGRLTNVTQPSSDEYNMTYDGATALLETFEKPSGATSTFTYDADGNLTENAHSGGFIQELVRTVNQPREIKVEYSHSGKSAVMTTTNDPVLRTRKVEDSTAPTKTVDYSSNYQTTSNGGYSSDMTLAEHARFGAQARQMSSQSGGELGAGYQSETFANSVTLSTPSDPFSITAWTKTRTLSGQDTTSSYNPSTKKWTITTPMGKTSNYTMDVHERVIQTQIGNLNATDFTYTNEHLTEIEQGTRTTTYTYSNTTGLLTSVTDPLSQTTSYTYDNNERIAAITRPDAETIYLTYNSVGQLASITPVGKPAHTFTFNASELPASYIPPTVTGISSPQTVYTYSANRIATITRPDTKVITYSYDSTSGLMTSIASNEATISITRDSATNLPSYLSSADRLGVRPTYTGRVMNTETTEEKNSTTFAHYYVRQFNSATAKISYDDIYVGSSSSPISYTYDNDEYLSTAGEMTYMYTTPNGLLDEAVSGSLSDQITSHTYNAYGEMLTQTTEVNSTQVHELTLTYDGAGRIKTKKDDIPSQTTPDYDYTYDNLGRLITVKDGATTIRTYAYDDNGNRTQKVAGSTTNYTYDDQDRLLSAGVYEFTYNKHGEIETSTNTFLNQTTEYTYDSFGNLTKVEFPNSDVIDYEIDAKNRRIGKIKNSTLEVRYIYADDLRIIAEINSDFTIKRRFIYGSKQNIPDYYIEGGTSYRIISDHLGSPKVIFNMSTGSIIAKMDFDEFGNITLNTNGSLKLPFGFAGGLYDWDTGLYRFGARDYDPVLGRWLSKDPILFEGGDTNLYGYVANDPVNWIDPRGTDKVDDFLNRSRKRRDDAARDIEKEKNPYKNAKTIDLGPFIGAFETSRLNYLS